MKAKKLEVLAVQFSSLEASLTLAGLAEYATPLRLLLNRILNLNLKYLPLAWDTAKNIKLISFHLKSFNIKNFSCNAAALIE